MKESINLFQKALPQRKNDRQEIASFYHYVVPSHKKTENLLSCELDLCILNIS